MPDSSGGFRVILPVWIWRGRHYASAIDEFVTCFWSWTLALSVETLSGHGMMVRLNWGAVPLGTLSPSVPVPHQPEAR